MKQFDPPPTPLPPRPPKKNNNNPQQPPVKISPRLPSNHSSLSSNVLYLQGIHNTCSKHKIIQYLRNHNFNGDHCDQF